LLRGKLIALVPLHVAGGVERRKCRRGNPASEEDPRF
jgi:hypothetical protein